MNRWHVFCLLVLCWALPGGDSLQAATVAEPRKPLIIGVFPRRDPVVTIRLFRPLQQYLSARLNQEVLLETAPDFETFQARLRQRRYDLVHLNQYQYVTAHAESGYEVVAQNEEQGRSDIRGAIYVQKNAGYSDLTQLKGKKIIFGGGSQAMISYVVPTFMLRQAGLGPDDYQEVFAATPPNAVLATYLGQGDAAGAGDVVLNLPLVVNKINTEELRLLAASEPLAHLPWAVGNAVEPHLKQRLTALLLGLGQSAEGKSVLQSARLTGIRPASDTDYDRHRQIIESLVVK